MHRLSDLAADLAALVWPTQCVSCGAPDRDLCGACRARLPSETNSPSQRVRVPGGPSAGVAGSYGGLLRALLLGYKHGGLTRLERVLGEQLRAPLLAAMSGASAGRGHQPLIVTVPSRASAVRSRGFRHTDRLVRAALRGVAAREGIAPPTVLRGALRAQRGRTSQVGLDARARHHNAGRIAVARNRVAQLRGREIVLVDDIITTGATVLGAIRALEAVGGRVVAVVALCATERRDGADPLL